LRGELEIAELHDLAAFSCQPDYQFSSGSAVLTGEGKNFYGGVTKAKLSITVTP
jgi:hypothetical protein